MSAIDQELFLQASRFVTKSRRPLLLTHAKPDGDALGSLVALRSLLRSLRADPLALLFDPIPKNYTLFSRLCSMSVLGQDVALSDLDTVDAVIVLDTCTYNQLEPIADWLRESSLPKLAIDHHATRDELADVYLTDETAAANCLILYEWAVSQSWPIDSVARESLFIGIATDTGWFRHSNADARALRAVAELTAAGVKIHQIHEALFQRESPARVRLLGAALHSLQLMGSDRLAMMTLTQEDFRACGAAPGDTENIVNEPLRIASVAVSVLLVEQEEGPVRVSFRSKPPSQESKLDVDVSKVAQSFGGGGHVRAAAARISGDTAQVHKAVCDAITVLLTAG